MKTLAQLERDVMEAKRDRINAWHAEREAGTKYKAAIVAWIAAVRSLENHHQKSRPITEAARCISRDSPENESPKPQEFKP